MIRYTDIGIQKMNFDHGESTYEIRVSFTDVGYKMIIGFYHVYTFTDMIHAPTYENSRTEIKADKLEEYNCYISDGLIDKQEQIRGHLLAAIKHFQIRFNLNFSQSIKIVGINKFAEIIAKAN